MSVAALILAAGRGTRVGGSTPKQYRPLVGRTVLERTLEAFLAHSAVHSVQPVVSPDDAERYGAVVDKLSAPLREKLRAPADGGATRQDSVRAGLLTLASAPPEVVLIHDGARPFAGAALIARANAAARRYGAAVPGLPVTDTITSVDEEHRAGETLRRESLRAVQTPQAFAYPLILEAHRRAAAAGLFDFSDDGALARWAGHPVSVFEGEPGNIKLTREADFEDAERRLRELTGYVAKTGTGFDVHALVEGDHLWLGGIRIAANKGVLAHSDGDVVLHAATDALLGALAESDIGVHFPPTDPQWRGASSDRFLAFAADRVRQRGGRIDHLDVTILCESPRIGPHRDAMRGRIAAILGVGAGAVSIKATTTERLGFIGRAEGIAAQAVATIRLPEGDDV